MDQKNSLNTVNLAEQPNLCRCCLIASGTWDLNKEYEGPGRVIEVFSDLLTECFGFALAHLQENSYSHNICDQCVHRLRDASTFRKQVLTAELAFAEYIDKTTHIERIFTASTISGGVSLIKVEPDLIQNNSCKMVYESDNESDLDDQGISLQYFKEEKNSQKDKVTNIDSTKTDNETKRGSSKSSKKVKKVKKFSKGTSKEVKLEPVDIYLPEHESIERENCKIFKKKSVKNNNTADISKSAESLEKNKQCFQNRILYRCLRENTALVLKNSTVIPFRYLRFTNGKYTCQYCELNYLQINDLRSHVEEQHANITEVEILSFLKWPVFQLTKAEISLIKCKLCADAFENLESLTDHFVNAHGKSYHALDFKPAHGILGFIVDSENPKCFLCSKEFPFFQALVVHMSEHGSENFKCDMCGKKFFTWTRLSVHKSRAHEKMPQTFKCKFCEEIFPKISTRQSHMKTKHRYGWLKCGECGDSFLDHKQRSRHMVKAHNYKTPSFSCSQCPKVFTSASNLGAHVKTHGDNKIYSCEVCGKKLTSKHSLTIHLRVHTGERPYACQFCEKRFKSYTILDMHERGHLNDKRYICELCDTAYVQIHSLRRHYRSHHPDSGIDLTKLRAKKVD